MVSSTMRPATSPASLAIICNDCGTVHSVSPSQLAEVTGLEATCSHCNRSFLVPGTAAGNSSAPPVALAELVKQTPSVFQQTSKKFKRIQLLGVAIIGLGLVLLLAAVGSIGDGRAEPTDKLELSFLAMFGGAVVFLIGRGLAWWRHG
jgi:hypothetical protein